MDLEIVKVAAAILIPFCILFFAAVIGIFRYFLKNFAEDIKAEFTQLEAKIEKNDAKVLQVERDFMRFQVELPKEYVMRRDFLRVTTMLEKKIDALGDLINKLNSSLSTQISGLKISLARIGEEDAAHKK